MHVSSQPPTLGGKSIRRLVLDDGDVHAEFEDGSRLTFESWQAMQEAFRQEGMSLYIPGIADA